MVLSSVIVFIIDIQYLVVLNPEGQAPIASNMQAPDSLPLPGQQVRFPEGKGAQFCRVLHVLEKGQHSPELAHGIRRQTLRDVLQVELFQALVDEVPDFHWPYCSLSPYTSQLDSNAVVRISNSTRLNFLKGLAGHAHSSCANLSLSLERRSMGGLCF